MTPTPDRQTILVVEDDPAIASAICTILERAGQHVACTTDPETATPLIENGRFDALVTHVFASDFDGTPLIQKSRQRGYAGRIIALCENGYFVTRLDAQRVAKMMGASAILPSSFKPLELLGALRSEHPTQQSCSHAGDVTATGVAFSVTTEQRAGLTRASCITL